MPDSFTEIFGVMLGDDTPLTITVGIATVVAVALCGLVWRAAMYLRDHVEAQRDQTREIHGLRGDIKELWTRRQQEKWAMELERRNRGLPLKVPNPEDFK